ncbi:MAG: PhzF family phenazine biosynthesis protein [Planctomycetota bacterium]|nr:PhzF family phenazine biosynthesis protein [Planctomycetota bacterium]
MTDPLEFRLVDAFALSPYSGNVAGVILEADGLAENQMQAIATEFNAPETAFILKPTTRDAAVRIRWFTPGCEVDFCGHATLAAVHALLESGRFAREAAEPATILPLESKSGILTVRTENQTDPEKPYTIWLDMPHCEPKPDPVNVPTVAKHLGLDPAMLDDRLPPIRTHDDDLILAVSELSTLMELRPRMNELSHYCARNRIRGVFVTTTQALSAATVVQSRFFAPAFGVDEDPVTGSAHGPLGLHLFNNGIVQPVNGRADFLCAQAKAGGRAGVVRVVVTESTEGAKSVRIGGSCITTATGTLTKIPKSAAV